MKAPRGPRGILPEDRALWDEVKKSIKPLRAHRPEPAVAPEAQSPPARRGPPKPAPVPAAPAPKVPPPLTKLDRRSRQRVARGRVEIDARLDLHGMTLERARERLRGFIAMAQSRGDRLILVITGKGTGGGSGALRREVPHWLSLPEFRPLVIGFEEAAPGHGGAGALYVRVRRARD